MAPRGIGGSGGGGGNNLFLASGLALLSYVPFEYVAKGSLIVCAILFIFDPIPPISRLLALFSLGIVYFLSKLHQQAVIAKAQQEEEEITIVVEEEEQPQQEPYPSDEDDNNNKSKND